MNQEKQATVSVIIPIYNVKEYLPRCIESVLSQTYTCLEIWLVDDGSTDGCSEICDEYAKKDERIRVIHKENGGLSDARNAALGLMQGEYLMFVDSDDFIHEDMISSLVSTIGDVKADMVFCSMICGPGSLFPESSVNEEIELAVFEKENIYELLFDDRYRNIVNTACGKLYKSEIYNSTRFPKGKLHEDEFVIHHILSKCTKVIYLPKEYYYHYERDNSITGKRYSLERLDAIEALEDRIKFFEEVGEERYICLSRIDYLRKVQYHYYSLRKYFPLEKDLSDRIKQRYREIYDMVKQHLQKKELFRYGLFIFFPRINAIIKNFFGATKI